MSLKGELTDLSLAELIEFFCNQRKTGRLSVAYPHTSAYFYLQSGAVVHASVGSLRGIEAVYYALTQSNASFNFSTAYEPPDHTINQPWTSVVLEGLRRMDEGIKPCDPFAEKMDSNVTQASAAPATVQPEFGAEVGKAPDPIAQAPAAPSQPLAAAPVVDHPHVVQSKAGVSESIVQPETTVKPKEEVLLEKPQPTAQRPKPPLVTDAFLASTQNASKFSYGPWKLAAVFAALILIIAGIAIPWGWHARAKSAKAAEQQTQALSESSAPAQTAIGSETSQPVSASEVSPAQLPDEATAASPSSEAADAARREREARAREEARLRAKAAEANAAATTTSTSTAPVASSASAAPPASGPKKVVVQVTYDENGRVTQASGNDPTALRIARQKRFPPGKAGSVTITIPIN
jgi:hypothetical protein